jgi:uncharacterized repeat protein (TIGR03803 family)
MNPNPSTRNAGQLLLIAFTMLVLTANVCAERNEKVLYSFQGGNDGLTPAGGVVFDKAGNLYGVTNQGGSTCPSPGCGTVFQLAPPTQQGGPWTETILYGFNGSGGSIPVGGAIIDGNGNLFGTTAYGGNGTCLLFGDNVGCGVVYELSPPAQKGGQWIYTVLYNFQGGKDGLFPWGDLALDAVGNLYGATQFGGGKGTTCNQYFDGNCGTVFRLSPPKQKGGKWTEKILHSFAGGTDGANPNGFLILDGNGAVYGLTNAGGNGNCNHGSGQVGCGTAFRLEPPPNEGGAWNEKVFHRFDRTNSDGGNPMAGLLLDSKGNLYGTTLNGGPGPGGIVFRLTPPSKGTGRWKEAVLYGFDGYKGSYDPESTLIFDQVGNLYGTAYSSRTSSGTVFRLRSPGPKGGIWAFTELYAFTGPPDGAKPAAGLAFDKSGNLYSTTTQGGSGACTFGCGTVFMVGP